MIATGSSTTAFDERSLSRPTNPSSGQPAGIGELFTNAGMRAMTVADTQVARAWELRGQALRSQLIPRNQRAQALRGLPDERVANLQRGHFVSHEEVAIWPFAAAAPT
ncbi:hypothetical protein J2X16_001519 [Pelomonas aquatica]|uniref:Uncharacterized protein n=1 Tax=Pelomonas aquatica TaxID=431058 RepID=A0ABU1Z6C4_9BURK|nr:hypothetical protein [Pelomonas aquatica]MDR7296180.1 hypothetical protein [Pelomonas aquatica]